MHYRERHPALRITTENVGATQVATVWVGETEVCSFNTWTRHPDLSLEAAEEIVARSLRDLIKQEVDRENRSWKHHINHSS